MTKSISISRFLTLALIAATHVVIFISMGNVWGQGIAIAAAYFAGFALFGAWASGPYVLSHWRAAALVDWPGVWVFPALSVVGAVFAFAEYFDAVFAEAPDAQAAIVFAVIPIYQYALILVATGVASWFRRRGG
jgi:hypothetical protein